MTDTECPCRCETCLDTDCEGHICKPHEVGRWIVVSPFMAHPLPSDFDDQEAAAAFIEQLGIRNLSVQQVLSVAP